jgi:hypothetical protein
LSKTVNDALCAPAAFGVNDTPKVHDLLGATFAGIGPQVPAPLTANSVGSDEMALEMASEFAFPVLVIIKFFVSV